jgi:Putative zinc-finger
MSVSPAMPAGWHVPASVLDGYVRGAVSDVDAWSVEAHLGACPPCRDAVSVRVAADRLERNRAAVLALLVVPEPGPVARLALYLGVPEHVLRLLTATPALRRSWLLSVFAVLAMVTGEAALARWWDGPASAALPDVVPFLLAGPLLVLASVAVAYLPLLDPSYRLTVSAPFSGLTLLLVRAVSATAITLVPVIGAAFVVPGPGWLPVALFLPTLAVCVVALAASVSVGPAAAAVAGVAWVVCVVWAAVARSPLAVIDGIAQLVWLGVLALAGVWLVRRRDRFEWGWVR